MLCFPSPLESLSILLLCILAFFQISATTSDDHPPKTHGWKWLKLNQSPKMSNLISPSESSTHFIAKNRKNIFEQHRWCVRKACPGKNTYCHHGECLCWPGFKFVPTPNANENETGWPGEGLCVREICTHDSECHQSLESVNFVCNNTICECAYGFHMHRQHQVCVKNVDYDVPGCSTTCRVVGGIFAIIFLLTLLYWCCYCVYQIVKNVTNRSQSNVNRAAVNSFPTTRWLTSSMDSIAPRPSPLLDPPPSYESLKLYESPPKYETAIEMNNLRPLDGAFEAHKLTSSPPQADD